MTTEPIKAFLVYQGGIANVFRVTALNLADYGRDAVRLYQGDYIAAAHWTEELDGQPFSDKFATAV